jgi:hypothetical protein
MPIRRALSGVHWQLLRFSWKFKPGEVLNLARLQGDARGVKAKIFFGLNGDQLGAVESLRYAIQGPQ